MSLHLRIAAAVFERAALARRVLGLLTGPVRHLEVSANEAAKLLRCTPDELQPTLDSLVEAGELRRRPHGNARGHTLYSLLAVPVRQLPKRGFE